MKKIYAILDLPTPILCDGEILGKTVNIKLGNFTGKIHFPVAKKEKIIVTGICNLKLNLMF